MQKELKKFIQHARRGGDTDESIKLQLLASGWNETDVNQALKWVSRHAVISKFLAALIIVVLLGAAAYLLFDFKKTESPDIAAESPEPLTCRGLLPDADLQEITGHPPDELLLLEGFEDAGSAGQILRCSYSFNNALEDSIVFRVHPTGSFTGSQFDQEKQVVLANKWGHSLQIGSNSYLYSPGNVYFISGNNKYKVIAEIYIYFDGAPFGSPDDKKPQILQQMARIVEINLNKY